MQDDTPTKPWTLTENDNVNPIERRRPQLRLIKGGKGPPSAPDKDWLSKLAVGTEFLCRDRTSMIAPRWAVIEWIMGGLHRTGNVLLIPAKTPNDPKTWQWVDPKEFCRSFDDRGIIEEPSDETDSNPS